ncbi:unnamed protein product [Phaeothamnion confervicola]
MAGQGAVLGRSFEDLRDIVAGVDGRHRAAGRVGVCLDTCHLFAAGYDIRTAVAFGAVLADFDRIVGASFLRALHLNDSKSELGSNRDRHERIGKGHIGLEAFRYIMNEPRFDGMPLVLETPAPGADGTKQGEAAACAHYSEEIRLLHSLAAPGNGTGGAESGADGGGSGESGSAESST